LDGGDWKGPPFAVTLQSPTYTHTEAGQLGGAAPHFGPNNNFAFQQVSLLAAYVAAAPICGHPVRVGN
jgi:hypothetical protein